MTPPLLKSRRKFGAKYATISYSIEEFCNWRYGYYSTEASLACYVPAIKRLVGANHREQT